MVPPIVDDEAEKPWPVGFPVPTAANPLRQETKGEGEMEGETEGEGETGETEAGRCHCWGAVLT